MREVFQQELREVQDRLVQIAELVETAIQQATIAFGSSDVALAEQVLDNGEQVDQLASELDEQTIDILARQQPVASDLRLMVGALRMSASLERMADLAQHIALLARYRRAVELFWAWEQTELTVLAQKCGGIDYRTYVVRVKEGHAMLRAELARRAEAARQERARIEHSIECIKQRYRAA